jgi:phospholipase D3/4
MKGTYREVIIDEKSPVVFYSLASYHQHHCKFARARYRQAGYIAVVLVTVCIFALLLLPLILPSFHQLTVNCQKSTNAECRIAIVESIPDNLTYEAGSPVHMSTFDAWMQMINSASETIDIAAFYWTLRSSDVSFMDPSDWKGRAVLNGLISAARDRKIKLRIVNNHEKTIDNDTVELINAGAEVRSIDFTELLHSGVLHTKLWIVDGSQVYVGSANMDWRSLTQVKELGAFLSSCPCVAADVSKLFAVYWYLGIPQTPIPPTWPDEYSTSFNLQTPMNVELNGSSSLLYLSSSPPPFCPRGRTNDIDAILDVINKAQQFVDIAVMDYLPSMLYVSHKRFWPLIDDALRKVSLERGVRVRLLASMWNHTRSDMIHFLRSLAADSGAMKADIQVKLFKVPAYTPVQEQVPFGRVNHNKYMVTDNTAYIGTSNWSEDYFVTTAGVGLIINQTLTSKCVHTEENSSSSLPGHQQMKMEPCARDVPTVQQQLVAIFDRDWNSPYAYPLPS